jgi:hypothetical protein
LVSKKSNDLEFGMEEVGLYEEKGCGGGRLMRNIGYVLAM